MAIMVAVKPARAGMGLKHPVSGVLPDEGGEWQLDQFTALLQREGSILRVETQDKAPAARDDKETAR